MKNTDLSKKGKTMRKTIQTYLSGFKIETFSPVSMALWAAAMVLSLYTPHEGNLYEDFLHIKAVLVYLLLGMLLIKILLLRELDILFDIATLSILIIYPIFHKFIYVSDRVNARKQSEIEAGVRCLISNPDK